MIPTQNDPSWVCPQPCHFNCEDFFEATSIYVMMIYCEDTEWKTMVIVMTSSNPFSFQHSNYTSQIGRIQTNVSHELKLL